MSLTADIKEYANEIGFQNAGVSPAGQLADSENVALSRVRDGLMRGLDWFTVERAQKICNPRLLMPSATSVISFAVSYLVEPISDGSVADQHRGRISRYAWSKDYHEVMRAQLQRIADFLRRNEQRDIATKLFVDSGPIAERAFAARCGIGWFGKSGNILAGRFGSWVFLGEIVTNLELDFDVPSGKTCGKCDLCLRSCPTGAIVRPYTVDAGRCISYLTIELKGAIPRELRPMIADRLFGCDICQDVCPVNRRAIVPEQSFIAPMAGLDPRPDLLGILSMSDDEYYGRFRSSPIHRAKKRGLQRNAAVALGNCGDTAVVPRLAAALDNPEEVVRGHVVWALGRLGGKAAKKVLEAHRARESNDLVHDELDAALASLAVC